MIKVDAKLLVEAEGKIKDLETRLSYFRGIYDKANELLAVLCAEGVINSRHDQTEALMGALHDVDMGVWDTDKVFK